MGEIRTASAYPTAFALRDNDRLSIYKGSLDNTCAPVDSQTFVAVWAGSSIGYGDWTGFDFADVPDNAIITSVQANIRTCNGCTSGGCADYYCSVHIGDDASKQKRIMGTGKPVAEKTEYANSEIIALNGLSGQYNAEQLRNMSIELCWKHFVSQDSAFYIFGMTVSATYEVPPTGYAVVGGVLREINTKFTGGVLTEIVSQNPVIGGILR